MNTNDPQEPAPLFGSWRAIYMALVVELLAITVLLYGLTRWLS